VCVCVLLLLLDWVNLLNRRDYETAATAAVDAVCVRVRVCVNAGVDACVGADAAVCDDKSSDPAAVAPFSTTNSTLMFVFFFIIST